MLFRFEQIRDPWQRCMEEGCALVRYHTEHPAYDRPGWVRLTIFHIPSFVDATGWTIRELREDAGFELQKVVWHQNEDDHRMDRSTRTLSPPGPTMSTATVMLDSDWWREQYAALSAMQMPLLPPCQRYAIADGETFGLRFEHHIEIEWSCEGPEGWQHLIDWTRACLAYFEELLP